MRQMTMGSGEWAGKSVNSKFRNLMLGTPLILGLPVAALTQDGLTVAEARASMVGRWEGRLELLEDGAASEAFDWPVEVTVEDAGDGRIYIERQQFQAMTDDGSLQIVVTLLDPDGMTEHGSLYSSGTLPEHRTVTLALTAGQDATHWTLYGVEDYVRDGEPLTARYLTTRDGDTVVTAFEIDPAGDEPPFGMTRRTLRRVEEAR